MPKDEAAERIDYLFAAPEARLDRWRDVVKSAQQCTAGTAGAREACAKLFAALEPYEDFFAYPGPRLMGVLKDRLKSGDMVGALRCARRISASLMSRAYRESAAAWDEDEDVGSLAPRRPIHRRA